MKRQRALLAGPRGARGTGLRSRRAASTLIPTARRALTKKRAIRVVVTDDHAVFRQGLRQLLELEPDIEVVGEAESGVQAIQLVRETHPDVVLMDISMPGVDGIAATRAVAAEHPDVRIIMLTMYYEHERAFQAIRAGAQGYLLKTSGAEDVIRAVRFANQGGSMVDPSIAPSLLREFQRLANNPGTSREERLSERDLTLLRLLVAGKSNKEIARHLTLAESTVKNNLSLLFQKLGARDRTQAAVLAMSRGVLPTDNGGSGGRSTATSARRFDSDHEGRL